MKKKAQRSRHRSKASELECVRQFPASADERFTKNRYEPEAYYARVIQFAKHIRLQAEGIHLKTCIQFQTFNFARTVQLALAAEQFDVFLSNDSSLPKQFFFGKL